MLDYKKISTEFSEKLHKFNKEDLLKWLDKDRIKTEFLIQLLEHEMVIDKCKPITIRKLRDSKEGFRDSDSQYLSSAA